LSRVEKLCILSFMSQGHDFHLYTYGKVNGIPNGVKVFDGEEILNSNHIFLNSDKKTYSGFSNLFRYKLLRDKGGIWVDLDVVCLRPFDFTEGTIIAQEVDEDQSVIVTTCVIEAPPNSGLMQRCYAEAEKIDRGNQKFGEIGPYFFSKFVKQHASQVSLRPPSVFCPVPYNRWSDLISSSPEHQSFVDNSIGSETLSVHLWNEMWRSAKIDKNGSFSSTSFFERACAKFGVPRADRLGSKVFRFWRSQRERRRAKSE